jgi:hypothetical protein
MTEKLFVVKKYIMARSAKHAIKKDKTHPVDDVWVDEEWRSKNLSTPIGYNADKK